MAYDRSQVLQLIGSLLVAALIVVATVAVVSAQLPLRELPREQEVHGGGDHSGPGGR
jgi:hypothetical protein